MGCWYSRKTDEEKEEEEQIEKIRQDLKWKLERRLENIKYQTSYLERKKLYRIWDENYRSQSTKQRLWIHGNSLYTYAQYHLIRSIWRHRYTDEGISDNEMKYIQSCLDKLVIFEEPYEGYRIDARWGSERRWLNLKFPDIPVMKQCINNYNGIDEIFSRRDRQLLHRYYIWNRRKFAVVLWKLL